jgi:hypothetical protein
MKIFKDVTLSRPLTENTFINRKAVVQKKKKTKDESCHADESNLVLLSSVLFSHLIFSIFFLLR